MTRIGYIIATYLITLLVFIAGKTSFYFCYGDGSFSELSDVISHGLSLDLSTSIYCILLPFLVVIVSIWWKGWGILRRILKVYSFILSLALVLSIGADLELYKFWGFKLDASVLQYLSQPSGMTQSLNISEILAIVIGGIVVIYLLYRLFRLLIPRSVSVLDKKTKIFASVVLFLFIPILIIGIRGGVNESTTNVGQVYFSQKQILNHAAVNPMFSFLASFEKSANNIETYDFLDSVEAEKMVAGLYPTSSENSDTLLSTQRPDIVIILLESCGGEFTQISGRSDIMPRFNALTKEGVYFSNIYGNTWRTDRGTVCSLSGYPSFPRSSVMKMPKRSSHLPSIVKSIRKYGYGSEYLYGGDINFTNMRSYLISAGFEKLTSMDDYSREEQSSARWGVRDDITFNTLLGMIRSKKADGRYIIGYSTLSSHEPWDVPMKKFADEKENAFYYLDHCIGDFIDKLKNTPQWGNLLVILLPDHGINNKDIDETKQLRNHIPMLWLGGAVKQPRIIEKICNQTDLAATLLGQMGIDHSDYRFSRDVVSENYTYPFAVHNYTEGFSMIDSTGFMVYSLDADKIVVNESSDAERLTKVGKAILQVTSEDLSGK